MSDVFKEQIVKKMPTKKDLLTKSAIIVLAFAVSIISIFIPVVQSLSVFVWFGAAFGAYFFIVYLRVEYEYIFTNGELDIDIIHNKSRRKRVFTGTVREFDIVAHVADTMHTGDFNSATEIVDYSSGTVGEHTYAFLTTYKGKRIKFIFEPNDMMLQAFSTVLTPRKLFKKI